MKQKPLNITELELNHANENTEDGVEKTIQKKDCSCQHPKPNGVIMVDDVNNPHCIKCGRKVLSQKEPEEAWENEWLDKSLHSDFTIYEQIAFIRSLLHRTKKEVRESTDKEARILCEMKKRVVRTQTIEEIKKKIAKQCKGEWTTYKGENFLFTPTGWEKYNQACSDLTLVLDSLK